MSIINLAARLESQSSFLRALLLLDPPLKQPSSSKFHASVAFLLIAMIKYVTEASDGRKCLSRLTVWGYCPALHHGGEGGEGRRALPVRGTRSSWSHCIHSQEAKGDEWCYFVLFIQSGTTGQGMALPTRRAGLPFSVNLPGNSELETHMRCF